MQVCFYQIYAEKIRDLLQTKSALTIDICEDPVKGIIVPGLTQVQIGSIEEAMDLI